MLKTRQAALAFVLAVLAAASLWLYVDRILVVYQITDAAAHDRPRGNLSDLYPRWLGARELMLRRRNPYSSEITAEIQNGYYGRALDASRPNDPKDRQGFAYPVYVIFLLAPFIRLPFHAVQLFFHWFLIVVSGVSVLLWLRVLHWRPPALATASAVVLLLGSVPAAQGIKLQQLSLLVAAALAASVASIVNGWLFSAGALLAVATIKPQLVWPLVLWLLVWSLSEWRPRRRFVFGFALTMAALLVGAEIILPGWWPMFLEAIGHYHQYTQNESILDQLVNWCFGRFAGHTLAALAALISGFVLWPVRKYPANSFEFGRAVGLVLALTVLIVPMYAPYNQVLLLPAILSLWKEQAKFASASTVMRIVYSLAVFALFWQWIASIELTVTWFFSHDAALMGWKAPFYATFALPVVVFALALFGAKNTSTKSGLTTPAK